MLINNRVIFGDNGTVTDWSSALSDYRGQTKTMAYVVSQDYLYIGGDLPFNHRYFDISTVNAQTAAVSVSLWDGQDWTAAVDVIDETSSGGASLAQDGIIRWTPDRDVSWGTEESTENITGLTTLKIYDFYWVRLSWDATLTASTALNYVGHKFSEDGDFAAHGYPEFDNSDLKSAYPGTGSKSDWNEQHFAAAEELLLKMRKNRAYFSPNKILEPAEFNLASIHKAAEIIYRAFGDDYKDQKADAMRDFNSVFKDITPTLDEDADARVDVEDRVRSSAWVRV